MKRILTCLSLAAIAAAAAGQAAADDVKIGYINKMGDHPWFVAEVAGAKAAAEAAGAAFVSQDVQFDANLTITTFDTMVGDGVKGIAIVVPDKAPRPGHRREGEEGRHPARRRRRRHLLRRWRPGALCRHEREEHRRSASARSSPSSTRPRAGPDKEVRIASIEDRKADTCMQRNQGAEEAFLKAVPGLQAGEHRPRPLRQHHGQLDRRHDHDADRQPDRHQLDLLLLQRRRRARRRSGARECRLPGRPGHGHRHRRQPRLRRLRRRQAERPSAARCG